MKEETFESTFGAMCDAYQDGGYMNNEITFVGKSGKEYTTTYLLFFNNNGVTLVDNLIVPLKANNGESFVSIDVEDIEAIIY